MKNNIYSGYMPPLSCAKRGNSMQKKITVRHQGPLQHSVITFGSPHAMATYMPFDAIVEGSRTGTERSTVTDMDGCRNFQDEEKNATQKKLERISQELQHALENLRKRKNDGHKLRLKLAVAQLQLEENEARRELTVDNLFELMLLYVGRTHGCCIKLFCLFKQTKKERDHALERLCEERAAIVNQIDVQKETGTLRRELEEARSLLASAKEDVKRLKNTRAEEAASSSQLVHQLERDLMRTQEQLQAANRELTEVKNKVAATNSLVEQVQLFVRLICRPDFYVVKDASLQPVERNRAEPTGFVLVPLTVLLQGYTLLSSEERRDLIESYQTYS